MLANDSEIQLKSRGVSWLVKREWLHLFSAFLNQEEQRLISSKVKETALRSVTLLRLEEEEKEIFVKRQRYPLGARLKQIFAACPGLTEWRMAALLLEKGVPTTLPVALGVRRRWGLVKESVLLTVGLGQVQDLFSYSYYLTSLAPSPARAREKRELAGALAELLRGAHGAGIFHRDLHGGNILVQTEKGTPPRLFLMDLHRVKVRAVADRTLAIKNLAQLGPFFQDLASRAERWRFLRNYFGDAPLQECGALAKEVEKRSRAIRQKFYRARDKRCLRENRDFCRLVAGRVKGYVRRSHFRPEFTSFLCELDWALNQGRVTFLKNSSGVCSLLVTAPLGQQEASFYVKVQECQGHKAWRYRWSDSRPKRAWVVANGLIMRGVGTPLPVAYFRIRKGLFRFRDFFVSEFVQDGVRIGQYISQELAVAGGPQDKSRKGFLALVAGAMARLHRHGVHHGDLKGNNILVNKAATGVQVLLVDLDGVRFVRRVSLGQRAKDLARLNASVYRLFSLRERLHFFQAYIKKSFPTRWKERKRLLAQVARLSEKKILKKGIQAG